MVDWRGTRAGGKEKAAKNEDTGGTKVKADAMQILTFADVMVWRAVIAALRKLMQEEDHKSVISLGSTEKSCLKNNWPGTVIRSTDSGVRYVFEFHHQRTMHLWGAWTPFVLWFPNLSSEDDKVAAVPIGTLKELDKMTASSLVTALTPKKSYRSIK